VRAAIMDPSKPLPDDEDASEASDEYRFVRFLGVQAEFSSPYQTEPGVETVGGAGAAARRGHRSGTPVGGQEEPIHEEEPPPSGWMEATSTPGEYGGDLISQVERYARFCLAATRGLDFDVIHAHDWMTYPAGMMIARYTGKPLVVHVHSTEFDRSGIHVNQRVYDIERRGMHAARRVIAVSQLTGSTCLTRYDVPQEHLRIVYNGVDFGPTQRDYAKGIGSKDKIVLYFGRITMQKGPEYFIAAAKRVLEVMDNVKFVVAGSGDMARHMIEMAANAGIGHKVLFTGFLRGKDIERVFSLADLYVMPSVSEPFGIAPLEAMSHDVPVLISKSSGVSEVLSHALKTDFWDIDDMANKIIAVLRHPPLSQTLREHGAFEVRRINWDGAAELCEQIYRDVIHEMTAPPVMKHA
jgi:glycosyltransferase involved in cell wall biosynthesis